MAPRAAPCSPRAGRYWSGDARGAPETDVADGPRSSARHAAPSPAGPQQTARCGYKTCGRPREQYVIVQNLLYVSSIIVSQLLVYQRGKLACLIIYQPRIGMTFRALYGKVDYIKSDRKREVQYIFGVGGACVRKLTVSNKLKAILYSCIP